MPLLMRMEPMRRHYTVHATACYFPPAGQHTIQAMGKLLVILAAVLLVVGCALWLIERSGFRGLPGDLRYEGQNVKVYFPIVTSLAISAY